MITRSQPFCLAAFFLTLLIGSLQAIAQTSSSPASNAKFGTISGRVVNESGRPLPTSIRDLDDAQPGIFRVGDSVRFVLTKGGVITGTVTNQAGEPIVGVPVRARMVADGGPLAFPQGAASLHGRVALREGETLPEKLYVYLVPAEKEKADDPLRFYGAAVTTEGKLALNNLAPGRYWVLAQTANQETASPLTQLRWPNQAAYRVKLRHDAEAAKTEIELKPCQKLVEIQVQIK